MILEKVEMKRLFFVFLFLYIGRAVDFALGVDHLRVESQVNPAIDSTPHFSWWLHSNKRCCMQSSYQIQIFSDSEMLNMVYDSGVKVSEQSQRVVLEDFSITPSNRYFWKVTVVDNYGEEAVSCETAYFDSGLMESGWDGAQWIMYPEEGPKSTGMPRFRKVFSLSKTIKSAYIYSSSLGIYDLTLNGQRVGHYQPDGTVIYDELKPGWTDFRKTLYYNVHEITNYLHEGANVIGSDVTNGWWNGRISWGLYGDYPLGFIAKILINYEDGTSDVVITDTSWKVTLNGPYKMGDIYNGEIYDSRLDNDWQNPYYNDGFWSQPTMNGFFSGKIVIQAAGQVRMRHDLERSVENTTIYDKINSSGSDYGTINIINSIQGFHTFKLSKGQTAIFDFGQNLVGYVKIAFKSDEGVEVRLRYAEMLNDTGSRERGNDGPGGSLYLENLRKAQATTYYYCKSSEIETYCPVMTYFGFRYCEVTADHNIEIVSIKAIPISSVLGELGDVSTDNSYVNQLFSNIRWGQLGNFVSVPTDCPQRDERWGWTGDTQVFSRTGMYNANSEAFYCKFLGDLNDSQRDDGAYPDCAPYTQGRGYGRAGWADAGIIVPWNLYLMYGNKDILRKHYGEMTRYMDWIAGNHSEGIIHAGPDNHYGDWLAYDECDKNYLAMAYYANDAMLMSKMSKALSAVSGDEYDQNAEKYQALYAEIKAEFNEKYWNPLPSSTAQSTYLLAIAFDLLDGDKKAEAIAKLQEAIEINKGLLSTGFLGTSIFLPTLSKCGLTNAAYSLLLQRGNPSWLYCIDQGATTIWERWDSYTLEKGFGPASMNSFNHYSYGAVGEWMYRYMGGIDMDDNVPHYGYFILRPSPDTRLEIPSGQERISHVSASYYSDYGLVKSEYTVNANKTINYECTVPPNTTAKLYYPVEDENDTVLEGDVLAQESEGVEYLGFSNGCQCYKLLPGSYIFKIGKVPTTTFKNTVNIQNDGHIEVYGKMLADGDAFTTTLGKDVALKLMPGENMTLTSLKIDDEEVTPDVVDGYYTIKSVTAGHEFSIRYDRTIIRLQPMLSYTTFCSTADLDFSSVNEIRAYLAKDCDSVNGMVNLEEVKRVPAGTGLVVVGVPDGSYQIPLAETVDIINENLLVGVDKETQISPATEEAVNFILQNNITSPVFSPLSEEVILSAGEAYLQIPGTNVQFQDLSIHVNETPTSITEVKGANENEGDYYTLTGQKVNNPQKGIFLKNGKKLIVR